MSRFHDRNDCNDYCKIFKFETCVEGLTAKEQFVSESMPVGIWRNLNHVRKLTASDKRTEINQPKLACEGIRMIEHSSLSRFPKNVKSCLSCTIFIFLTSGDLGACLRNWRNKMSHKWCMSRLKASPPSLLNCNNYRRNMTLANLINF
jgi:hypothetical protein